MMARRSMHLAMGLLGLVTFGVHTAHGAEPSFADPRRFVGTDGAQLYRMACQGCHMRDGKGATGAGTYPALAGNPKLTAAGYPIHVVLSGQRGMPEFGSMLNEAQVAAVVNHVRTNFGNSFTDKVTAEDVRAMLPAPTPMAAKWLEVSPHTFLRYQRTGTGRSTVVLLHSLGSALEHWDELVPALARRDRTILRFDQRGAGLSTKIRERLGMEAWVEDLAALLDRLGLQEPVVLVGDTFGATIALQFAATYPERAAGVVALGPTGNLIQQPKQLAKFPDPLLPGAAPATLAESSDTTAADDPDAAHKVREKSFDAIYPPSLRSDEKRYARFLGIAYSTDPTSAVLTMRALYSVGFKETFSRVGCPVIMAAGKRFVRPVSVVREMANAIPNARFVELDTGHYAGVQSPELVEPLVRQFLAELDR